MLKKRGIFAVVFFTIITCGIYAIYWTYVTCTALQAQGRKLSVPPVLTTLMMLFISPVGGALLGFDADENVNSIKQQNNLPTTDNKVLWIVLGVLIPVVTQALVQHEINMLLDGTAAANAQWQQQQYYNNQYNQNNGNNNGNP